MDRSGKDLVQHLHGLVHELKGDVRRLTRDFNDDLGRVKAQVTNLRSMLVATKQEIIDKITGQTTVLKSIDAAVDGLKGSFTSLEEAVADLKKQIEAGGTPDFTEVEAALDEHGGVLEDTRSSVIANTPLAKG